MKTRMTREEFTEEVMYLRSSVGGYDNVKRALKSICLYVDELEAKIYNFESRTCEGCKHFYSDFGVQPDGLPWGKIECELGVISKLGNFNYTKIYCSQWEQK